MNEIIYNPSYDVSKYGELPDPGIYQVPDRVGRYFSVTYIILPREHDEQNRYAVDPLFHPDPALGAVNNDCMRLAIKVDISSSNASFALKYDHGFLTDPAARLCEPGKTIKFVPLDAAFHPEFEKFMPDRLFRYFLSNVSSPDIKNTRFKKEAAVESVQTFQRACPALLHLFTTCFNGQFAAHCALLEAGIDGRPEATPPPDETNTDAEITDRDRWNHLCEELCRPELIPPINKSNLKALWLDPAPEQPDEGQLAFENANDELFDACFIDLCK